jgi:hypothetical protein
MDKVSRSSPLSAHPDALVPCFQRFADGRAGQESGGRNAPDIVTGAGR